MFSSDSRDLDLAEYVLDDLSTLQTLNLVLWLQYQSVGNSKLCDRLNVVRGDEISSSHCRYGSTGFQ